MLTKIPSFVLRKTVVYYFNQYSERPHKVDKDETSGGMFFTVSIVLFETANFIYFRRLLPKRNAIKVGYFNEERDN